MSLSSDQRAWFKVHQDRQRAAAQGRRRGWFCDACARQHGMQVDRLKTLDGRTICFRQFDREQDRQKTSGPKCP